MPHAAVNNVLVTNKASAIYSDLVGRFASRPRSGDLVDAKRLLRPALDSRAPAAPPRNAMTPRTTRSGPVSPGCGRSPSEEYAASAMTIAETPAAAPTKMAAHHEWRWLANKTWISKVASSRPGMATTITKTLALTPVDRPSAPPKAADRSAKLIAVNPMPIAPTIASRPSKPRPCRNRATSISLAL